MATQNSGDSVIRIEEALCQMFLRNLNKVRNDKIIGFAGIKSPGNLSKKGCSGLEADQNGLFRKRAKE